MTGLNAPENDPTGIYTLDQLPDCGLVLHLDILTYNQGSPRLMRVSPSTFKRRQKRGDAPPTEWLFGRKAQHAEHIRAILLGQDWRDAKLRLVE
ncbi:hypothetical protein [Tateyamaria sp.]|uniref:hypothetical protein n=1 Tax=Tateyamaria sp. TaxID=1929288 RepID=UPI00329BB1ED